MKRGHYILICAVILVPLCALCSLISFFRLSSDTAALRQSAMASVSGTWQKKVALNAGRVSTGLICLASHYVKMEAEPRAALDSLRGAEVGVYTLRDHAGFVDHAAMLASADKIMATRGWERIVGVSKDGKLVAVYFPHRLGWTRTAKCSVLVFDGSQLVVVSARGKLQPLFDVLAERLRMNAMHLFDSMATSPQSKGYATIGAAQESGWKAAGGRSERGSPLLVGGH
jgi:hypothetical protein